MADKGINSPNSLEGYSGWYIVSEAECDEDLTDLESFEKLFDESDGSDISNLIDNNDEPDQGNSLALLNKQLLEECSQQITELKRKYISSPKEADVDLSPQLQSVSISSETKNSKRRLFADSGIGNEAEDSYEAAQVSSGESSAEAQERNVLPAENGGNIYQELLKSRNATVTALAKFKETFGVSYKDLTRIFKSNKTCCASWVFAVFGLKDELYESSKTLLQTHCVFFQVITYSLASHILALYLCEFKSAKNRETLLKLICPLLNVQEAQVMADPPKLKSVMVALYFYKQALSSTSYKYGEFPAWILNQTIVSHHAEAETFQLAKMVQFAYDNNIMDESTLAYQYAQIADEDPNAAAWLNSNNQARYLKDCCTMAKHYKRFEMRNMSTAEWIFHCCDKTTEMGDWKVIAKWFRFQEVNFILFLSALRAMFKNTPKKQCIVFTGPPNTGKSYFVFSLINFLQGKVVSFMNAKSHFWLQPLADCKFGFLDDATDACWTFIDTYMRNGLDGTPVSLDSKHKNPMQIRLPALFVTSNVEVDKEVKYQYLHSRLTVFNFSRKMPLDGHGNPLYPITDASWNSFFTKLDKQLDISRSPEPDHGEPERAFRCCAGEPATTF
ncbi:E1 [Human papillomavirus 186]|nr:E1 [Human papillomavirus 186]